MLNGLCDIVYYFAVYYSVNEEVDRLVKESGENLQIEDMKKPNINQSDIVACGERTCFGTGSVSSLHDI